MKKTILKLYFIIFILFLTHNVFAWEGMPMPPLHVEGRYLKDPHGNIVNLHGYAQTFSPWFNEQNSKWNNYNVSGCLTYNKDIIDRILAAGWKMNFVRMHMDPYWSNDPDCTPDDHELPNCFDEGRFRKYLDEVFIPMTEYAISKGMYVILRPPGVSPEEIGVEDDYNYAQYLMNVWDIVSQHPKIKSRHEIMFELANEPVRIRLANGSAGSNTQAHFDVLKEIFQPIVNKIRENGFHNVLWIPGSGYQSQYKGYAVNPIEGENIGYAVHIYPGWFGSANGYDVFKREWDENVQAVADFAPIVITEMDWAPEKYQSSWGKGITGVAGGEGFGANFKKIMDESGNVSWLLFTEPHHLAAFTGIPPALGQPYTFLNDPEACPWPIYHWYQDYAKDNYPRADFEYRANSDNGDGTFANPVINADFPAPVLIRDNNTYYLISSNTNIHPNTTILQSNDLVNWEFSLKQINEISLENVVYVDDSNIQAGSLVETQTGEWWAIISYDMGSFGSFPHLLPVSWSGDNPIVDETAKDATALDKPEVGMDYFSTYLTTNDNFRDYNLGVQWGWNNIPDDSKWKLLERPGFMRLKTVQITDSVHKAQNILTQRIFAYPADPEHSYGTIRMEIDNMANGDIAGLSIFQDAYSYIGVKVSGDEKNLIFYHNDETQIGPIVSGEEIYLRAIANYSTSTATLFYSFDNSTYTQLGTEIELAVDPSIISGNKFGIFNFATIGTGGYVDIDWFSTESEFLEDAFYNADFEQFTEESLTLTDFIIEGGENITVLTNATTKLVVKAVFADGRIEDVAAEVKYTNHHPEVIKFSRGYILSQKDGLATLDISYTSPLGIEKQATLQINSTTFPLTNEFFSPNIWENGSFDETTRTLHTGPYGFGGWRYDGLDLSDYKYIIVRLGSDNNASVDFRLFDKNDYWAKPASFSFGNNSEVVIILDRAMKEDNTPLNTENIYIAGFWSNGNNPFIIDTVFLTNSSEYDPPTIYTKDHNGNDIDEMDGFSYIRDMGPSESQSFLVSGKLLVDAVKVESSENFEISLDETMGYTQILNLEQADGLVAPTTVYVRMRADLARGTHTGEITLSSPDVWTETISLAGTVDRITAIDQRPGSGATIVSKWYYTIMGQKIHDLGNLQGLFIVKELYSDGSIATKKIYKGY